MEYQSCLDDLDAPIVTDTSVIINLNATGYAEAILRAVPNHVLAVEEVSLELEDGRRRRHSTADALVRLVASGVVRVVRLGDVGRVHFVTLVGGRATETLDDGEAATIASALERDGIALIDERKALRICAERFLGLRTGHTLDLLSHREVRSALAQDELRDAVFKALYNGRMSVPNCHVEWVINLVGKERASKCSTLSGQVTDGSRSVQFERDTSRNRLRSL